jgi:hypothetical protein
MDRIVLLIAAGAVVACIVACLSGLIPATWTPEMANRAILIGIVIVAFVIVILINR